VALDSSYVDASQEPKHAMIDDRLRALVRRNYTSLWKLVRRCGVDAASADDAVQEIFVVVARRLDDIEEGSEQSFLYGIAIRVAWSFRRKQGRSQLGALGSEVEEQATPELGPDEELDARRRRALLDSALDELDETLRVVLVLHVLEGMAVRDVAKVLQIPEGTATSRLRRARESFAAIAQRIRARGGRLATAPRSEGDAT
jgi:RNA polymerase sigma-70 factor, ECF subfamily